MCKVFPLLRRVKRDTYCILVGDFEVRVRVRRVIRQKAHVRAKCVRGKTSKCGVRACDGKFVALQHSEQNRKSALTRQEGYKTYKTLTLSLLYNNLLSIAIHCLNF